MKWIVRKKKIIWNNGDVMIVYDVGKYDKIFLMKTWVLGKTLFDEKEANDFCNKLNNSKGIKEQFYMDGGTK